MGIAIIHRNAEGDWLRKRGLEAIQGAAVQSAMAALPMQSAARPDAGLSSIGKARGAEGFSASRPQLEAPPTHFMPGLIRVHSKYEEIFNRLAKLGDAEINQAMAKIERLEVEKTEQLRKQAASVQSQNTWGVVANVAQYLMSGTAIVLGVATLPAAPWAGGMLIASGVVGLGAKVMHDTGAYSAIAKWFTESAALQKKIATSIEVGMFFLSLGFGLAGGMWAHNLGALAAANNGAMLQKIGAGIGLGASVGKGTADLNKAFLEKNISHLKADMQNTDDAKNLLRQMILERCKELEKCGEIDGDLVEQLKQAIEASRVNQD